MPTNEKIIKSGSLLEADFYPVFESGRAVPAKEPRKNAEAQKKYNRSEAKKKIVRLVNANFDASDNWCHLTYSPDEAPADEAQARRDIRNFMRRVKTKRAAKLKTVQKELDEISALIGAGLGGEYIKSRADKLVKLKKKLGEELKYIYAVEEVDYKIAALKGKKNWHFHLFISGGLTESEIVAIWKKGRVLRASRFRPDRFGFESAARYMQKDPKGKKSFVCSKNLKKPDVRVRPAKLSDKTVEKTARLRVDDAPYWERRYKGYAFIRCEAKYNEYNSRWYMSVVMRKKTDPRRADEYKEEWAC